MKKRQADLEYGLTEMYQGSKGIRDHFQCIRDFIYLFTFFFGAFSVHPSTFLSKSLSFLSARSLFDRLRLGSSTCLHKFTYIS